MPVTDFWCCNSTYSSRYAPQSARQQRSKAKMRSAHLKYLSKAKVKQKWSGNSTYRLWYAPQGVRQQRSKASMRSAHLKYLNEEKVKQRWLNNRTYRLRYWNVTVVPNSSVAFSLQQPLPFTVLKRKSRKRDFVAEPVATALPITVLKLMVRHNIA